MGPRLINRGNVHQAMASASGNHASMGPRLINRGNLAGELDGDYLGSRFNGAAVDQPRKFLSLAASPHELEGFNGAAVDQPRKCLLDQRCRKLRNQLQWGRG